MRVVMIVTGLVMLVSLGAFAQPRLEIEETVFDFGYIPNVGKVGHSFIMRSSGTDSLRIINVKPGCGCTKAPIEKQVVAPGDSTAVELIFSSVKAYQGTMQKTATVTCNDDARGTFQLRFKANVNNNPDTVKPAQLTPWSIQYNVAEKAKQTTVVVKNVSTEPLLMTLVSNPSRFLDITVPSTPIAPGKSAEIKVKIQPSVHEDVFEKSFTIETKSGTLVQRYTVPVVLGTPVEDANGH